MSVITMTFPLIVWPYFFKPEFILHVIAVVYCVDFYVMTWAFDTPLFGVHAAARTVAASLIWFSIPDRRFSVLPAMIAVFYLATILLNHGLRERWLARQRARA